MLLHLPSSSTSQNADLTEDYRKFQKWPPSLAEQDRLTEQAQTPDKSERVLCWRRCRQCRNPDCYDPSTDKPHKFSAAERDEWNCPDCGWDRHCRNLVKMPNRGCYKHGGSTPVGWENKNTKTGEYSPHISNDSLRADYEAILNDPKLLELNEHIALLQALIIGVIRQFSGGASRQWLQEVKINRDAHKKAVKQKEPDLVLLRELEQEFDEMLSQGSSNYQVNSDYLLYLRQLTNLIEKRDKHAQVNRMTLGKEQAMMMLEFVKSTFSESLWGVSDVTLEDIQSINAIASLDDEVIAGQRTIANPAKKQALSLFLQERTRKAQAEFSRCLKKRAGEPGS